MIFDFKSNPIRSLRAVHCLYRMCRRALVVVLGLLIDTRLRLDPRWKTSQYRRTFVPISVSLWNNVSDPVFDGVGLASSNSRANVFLFV